MRISTVTKDKPEGVYLRVKSAESSSTIPRGAPVCLAMNATNDGLAVVLPGTTAANSNSLVFGVATAAITAGSYGEVQAFGYCRYAIIRRGTRAASTDSWTSTASNVAQCLLNIDTVNNCFSSSGGTLAASAYLPGAILAESLASIAASESATSDTRTAYTTSAKVFLRLL